MSAAMRQANKSGATSSANDVYVEGAKRNIVARGMKRFEAKKRAPPQPAFEIISPRIASCLGQNPSDFTLNGTNCYLVGTGDSRILIDTGDEGYGTEEFVANLRECMQTVGCKRIELIVVTHMHSDHYGNVARLQDEFGPNVPVAMTTIAFKYQSMLEVIETQGLVPFLEQGPEFTRGMTDKEFLKLAEKKMPKWPGEDSAEFLSWDILGRSKIELQRTYWFMKRAKRFQDACLNGDFPFIELHDGMELNTVGASLQVMHTPGHSPGHVALFLLEDADLFSGDTVLGYGTTFFMDLYDYMGSLRKMLASNPKRLMPGHGPYIEDGAGYISRYILHRDSRENQLVEAMEKFHFPKTAIQIARLLYVDTPKTKMNFAVQNISKILLKLVKENRVCAYHEMPVAKTTISRTTPKRFTFVENLLATLPPLVPPGFKFGGDIFFAMEKKRSFL
jgi:glyoxylase-like metal-dependent hydrolase (beta-lactamase superfamily II)